MISKFFEALKAYKEVHKYFGTFLAEYVAEKGLDKLQLDQFLDELMPKVMDVLIPPLNSGESVYIAADRKAAMKAKTGPAYDRYIKKFAQDMIDAQKYIYVEDVCKQYGQNQSDGEAQRRAQRLAEEARKRQEKLTQDAMKSIRDMVRETVKQTSTQEIPSLMESLKVIPMSIDAQHSILDMSKFVDRTRNTIPPNHPLQNSFQIVNQTFNDFLKTRQRVDEKYNRVTRTDFDSIKNIADRDFPSR